MAVTAARTPLPSGEDLTFARNQDSGTVHVLAWGDPDEPPRAALA